MKIKGRLPYCLFLLALLTNVSSGEDVRISTFQHETLQIDVSVLVMNNIYERLGHEMKLIRFPGKRALVQANEGSVDGELIRVKSVESQLPNLVRIPVVIGHIKGMALSLKDSPEIVGKEGLVDKRIGILRGVELTNRITTNLSRQVLNSIDSLFQSLLVGRVDVVLFPELDAKKYLADNQLAQQIKIHREPIITVPLYHYLHKNKPTLIQQVTQTLEKLKTNGELDAIISSAEQALQ